MGDDFLDAVSDLTTAAVRTPLGVLTIERTTSAGQPEKVFSVSKLTGRNVKVVVSCVLKGILGKMGAAPALLLALRLIVALFKRDGTRNEPCS